MSSEKVCNGSFSAEWINTMIAQVFLIRYFFTILGMTLVVQSPERESVSYFVGALLIFFYQ